VRAEKKNQSEYFEGQTHGELNSSPTKFLSSASRFSDPRRDDHERVLLVNFFVVRQLA
jgi:hypothetical protein